jgi:hypothetical protein
LSIAPTLVAVAPSPFEKGYAGPGSHAAPVYRVRELRDALLDIYPTDAHLVSYVVRGATIQPRINKAGLPHFDGVVEVGVVFCDVDNPDHREWNDALIADARRQYDELEVLRSAGVYHTQHGWRVVQPLVRPVRVEDAERYIKSWLFRLEAAGLAVDWACRDWTRHFRLPNVRRKGRDYRSPWVALDRMAPIEIEPIRSPPTTMAHRAHASALVAPVDWSRDVPAIWRERVESIATAVREVKTEWHTLFLALAGALHSRDAPPEHVPALCRAISLATGSDSRTHDREQAGRTTVERRLAGLPATGYGQLATQWPSVAEALDHALARGTEAQLRAQAAATEEPPVSLAETTRAMENAIRRARDGLTLISAECGLGKTRAASRVAAERAAKEYATDEAQGLRAPLQSKTAISVDKHELGKQIVADLRPQGVRVRRIFGPLSVLRPDGTHECRYYEVARPFVDGGQSMQWELCLGRNRQRCPHYDHCTARVGVDGPDDARITVGPHALLSELDAEAGSTGVLIIDEPPPILETVVLTLEQIDTGRLMLHGFDGPYQGAMTPALEAVRAWLAEVGEIDRPTELAHAIRACAHAVVLDDLEQARRSAGVAGGDAVDCARAAPFPEWHKGTAPPLRAEYVSMARDDVALASRLGLSSRVLSAVYQALTSETPVAVRIEEKNGHRVLVLTAPNQAFAAALRREGSVVVTDANVEVNAPIYAKVVGYTPPHHRFTAKDGAPIERTLLRYAQATRRSWFVRGKLSLEPCLIAAVLAVFDWAAEDPGARRLGIITMQALELASAAALRPENSSLEAAWKRCGQKAETLMQAREVLGPIIRAWPGEIVLAHYGAVRGLDTMADVDALATLGDPWPNLGEVKNQVAFLGLKEPWDARVEALCRAELEQAHGRLRVVHRTRPGRALHVGNVMPGGSGWKGDNVHIRRFKSGRPRNAAAMDSTELAHLVVELGGVGRAAAVIDCDRKTLSRYLHGQRSVPTTAAVRLRSATRSEAPHE